jgi:hypothetical protein
MYIVSIQPTGFGPPGVERAGNAIPIATIIVGCCDDIAFDERTRTRERGDAVDYCRRSTCQPALSLTRAAQTSPVIEASPNLYKSKILTYD